ncbi:unnamed protein product [Lasius platythorax]|uniref:Uncharacterized protein n=1 Tax=Lasius platythorax TaxID=488582 RepID=A0AAV2NFJ8_9HYME
MEVRFVNFAHNQNNRHSYASNENSADEMAMRLASSSSYVEQTDMLSLVRPFQREKRARAHKVILGCEKFVLDETSLPVSYEVSPFCERG